VKIRKLTGEIPSIPVFHLNSLEITGVFPVSFAARTFSADSKEAGEVRRCGLRAGGWGEQVRAARSYRQQGDAGSKRSSNNAVQAAFRRNTLRRKAFKVTAFSRTNGMFPVTLHEMYRQH
jgi:hypothetical protein